MLGFLFLALGLFTGVLAKALPSHQPRTSLFPRYTAPEGRLAFTMTEYTRLTDNKGGQTWGEKGRALVLGPTKSSFEGAFVIDIFATKESWKTDQTIHTLQCVIKGIPDASTVTIDISNRIPYFKPQIPLPFNTGTTCEILA